MGLKAETPVQILTRDPVPHTPALWPPHTCSPSLCFSPTCPESLWSHASLGPVHFYLICGIPFRTVCESIIENIVTAEASYLNFKCH